MKIKKDWPLIPAKNISYSSKGRALKDITAVVFHYTGNKGDTAEGNCRYFATNNTRTAGAHFFISKDGTIMQSMPIGYSAYAVGGFYSKANGGGKYYQKLANSNTISIELCDAVHGVSWKQMKASRKLYLWILQQCKNITKVVRHWDVNGKTCPLPFIGANNKKWKYFRHYVKYGYQYRGILTKKAAIRTSPGVKPGNRIRYLPRKTEVKIVRIYKNWGKIGNSGDLKGKWISLKKVSAL